MLLDSGVLILALGRAKKDPGSALSMALFDALVKAKKEILVAAPSLAELEAGPDGAKLPRNHLIEVVPFDRDAAEELARSLPPSVLKEFIGAGGQPGRRGFFKYDALIVACAKRHRANCIVSTDENDLPKLAAKAGVKCIAPKDLEHEQRSLEFNPSSQPGGTEAEPPGPKPPHRIVEI
jgi:hypothetical protein